jgi:NAD(P)-dependent dehydrogenase (short-subunit alcohol dehydrogenase family)
VKLAGEVAVITGAASGIGRGTALAMARAGADIVLADVNDARLAAVAAEIAALGRRVLAVHCDVSRDQDVERLAEEAEARLGPVGLLMNNAGVVLRGALEKVELADWQWCLGINVFGVIRGIHAFLPRMIERRHGYIVNTGSVAGLIALTGEGAPYIASKFAVAGLTEALALYARPFGIGVSLLCPGGVNTNLAETGRSIGMTPERERSETRMAQAVQGGEEQQPEDVGDLVVEAVRAEQFLILPDELHAALIRRRAQDVNEFLKFRFEAFETQDREEHSPL